VLSSDLAPLPLVREVGYYGDDDNEVLPLDLATLPLVREVGYYNERLFIKTGL
jgi:hypothetical protein